MSIIRMPYVKHDVIDFNQLEISISQQNIKKVLLNMFITAFVFLLLIGLSSALQPGDRISMLTQSLHSDSKTDWIDMPVHMMPRFGEPDSHIFHTVIPKFSENSTDYRINPRSDLKISFTFLGNKLSIPWIAVYSAKDRISLKRLVIKFTRDEFEVVQVDVEKIYGSKLARIDPTHPALRGFELQYKWENVQEEDFGLGAQVMFCSCLISFIVLFLIVICNSELVDVVPMAPSTGSSGKYRKNRGR